MNKIILRWGYYLKVERVRKFGQVRVMQGICQIYTVDERVFLPAEWIPGSAEKWQHTTFNINPTTTMTDGISAFHQYGIIK